MNWLKNQKMHFAAAVMFTTLLCSHTAWAVGQTIKAEVYNGKPARLTIATPKNNSIVSSSPITVEGEIHNIGQIMVYLDEAYSMTHPVDTGSETYNFTTTIGNGPHTLKLVGINPYDGTTVEQSVSFVYTPSQSPVTPIVVPVDTIKKKAEATQEYMKDQVDQASITPPATRMSDALYEIMKSVDLVPITSEHDDVQTMAVRFWSVTSGTALLVMTQPMISLYHLVRYRLLEWNVHALPNIIHHHATLVLRVGGVLLLAVGFLI